MALGLRLRVTNTQDRNVIERTFDRFPVRVGRNPLNDFQLDSPFVSQFHAVLELHGNQLMLRDLGSKNGTMLRNAGKMQSHALVDLGPSNYEFAISSLFFQAFPLEVSQQAGTAPRKKGTLFLEGSMPAAAIAGAMGGPQPPGYAGAGGIPPQVQALSEQLRPLYDGYRAAWGQYYQSICLHAGTLDPVSRAKLLEQLVQAQPATAFEPDFQRLAQVFKANLPPAAATVGASTNRDEMLALQAVKELAAQYTPGRTIEGADAIMAFLSKLQDTLDVFFKCFIPLRDGYKQFESKMEIKRTVRPNEPMQSIAAKRTVENARDPKELALRLLDWTDATNDGPRTIESTFADLMIHQVAMLDGIMRGVKSLLKELSPKEIEGLAEKKKVGKGVFGKNYEALWNVFAERHSDLADEDKEAFALIFGPQFVQAYTQISGEASGAERMNTAQRPVFPMPSGAGQSSANLGAVKGVPPAPANPNAPNPFEWPPPPPPAGNKRGGF